MSVSGVSPDTGTGVKRTLDDTEVRGAATSGDNNKKYKQDLASLPTRQYLDQTVVPILLQVGKIQIRSVLNKNLTFYKKKHLGG